MNTDTPSVRARLALLILAAVIGGGLALVADARAVVAP